MSKLGQILAVVVAMGLAGCASGGEGDGVEDDGAVEVAALTEASAAPPVLLGGDLPGMPGAQAIAIAVARFNQIGLFAPYEPFRAEASYNWAYAAEGRHYVESYTYGETCGAYVTVAGVIQSEFCYLRIGL